MRYLFFILAIAAGVGLGLFYGWVVSPVELVDTAPNTLRIDYKTDFVLMVAEAYSVDHDLNLAARRLAQLGYASAGETVSAAETFALQNNYPAQDLALIRDLGEDLKTWNPAALPALTHTSP